MTGACNALFFYVEGRPVIPGKFFTALERSVDPGYFAAAGIPLRRGRGFTPDDGVGFDAAHPRLGAIVVSESMAKTFFPNEDPIGKRITLDFVPDERPREIVAIVGDTRATRLQKEPVPTMYVPHVQQTVRWLGPQWNDRAGMFFILRTSSEPLRLVETVKRAVADVDLSRPATNFRTIEDNLSRQTQYLRLYMLLLGIFGGIAAILAAIGIYGIMAYSVAERTREIGIRMALGAGFHDVLKMVVRHAMLLVSIGCAGGLAASFALTRLVSSGLYGVTATDPATYGGISLLLIVVAIIACLVPTLRAIRVDPTIALRYE
jgi:predicted permease